MKRISILMLSVLVTIMFAYSASYAATFQVGDIFAGTASGTVEQWRVGTGLVDSFAAGSESYITGMTFGGGDLYVTNFSYSKVSKIAGPTDPHTTSTYVNQESNPESIVFDKAGNAYVSSASNGDIKKYDAAGNLLLNRNTGYRADFVDLTADNTTLYYTQDVLKGVWKMDIATGTTSLFESNYGNYALRLLGDGSLLVANQADVVLLDSTGNFVRSYDTANNNSWFAMNLDPDGKTFWSADFSSGDIQRFDIATGTALDIFHNGAAGGPWGLAIYGEITQGGGGGKVPEPATMLLFGAGLAGLGIMRKRFKV